MNDVNYEHWFNLGYWTLEEAAYLFVDIDPNDTDLIDILTNRRNWNLSNQSYQLEPSDTLKRFKLILQTLETIHCSNAHITKILDGKFPIKVLFEYAKQKNIRIYSSLLKEWELSPINQNKTINTQISKPISVPDSEHFGQDIVDAFDPLPITAISNIFSTVTSISPDQWKVLASKAKKNGLIDARTDTSTGSGKSLFNPVKVASWLIIKKGISPERLSRKLKSNLPSRNNSKLEDLFGLD